MKRLLTTLFCAGLLAIAGCGTTGGSGGGETSTEETAEAAFDTRLEALYEEAQQEGQLTWYNQFVPDNEAQIVQAFTDTFPGIQLNTLRLTGAEASQRFAAESDAGAATADVLTQTQQGFAGEALSKGWAIELTPEEVPTLEDIDEQFVQEAQVVNAIAPVRLAINSDLVDEAPTSWENLLDEEYKGQIILVDPRSILAWMTQFDVLRQEYGIEYLEGLAAQDYRLVESAVPGSQSLAAGEAKALIPSLDSVSNPLISQGAPIESVVLSPTTGVENASLINAKAQHPAAARLFVAWLCTPAGQEAVNGNGFGASPLVDTDIEGALELGDDYKSPDQASALQHTAEITQALGLG
jgi:iron(III) transport system substrate-binding protein